MERELVPKEQSLDLKELGFEYVSTIFAYDEAGELYTRSGIPHDFNIRGLLSAPSFSQAFRWFREKYDLHYVIVKAESWFYTINGCNTQEGFNTYEEAEQACLDKLIEIVKNKQD